MRVCKAQSCTTRFEPTYNSIQPTCGNISCAIEYAESKRGQDEIRKARKRELNEMRQRHRDTDKSHWRQKADQEFNRWIRNRDKGQPCISCGKPAKKENAGHFIPKGRCPALRYDPDNVHLQCEACNTYLSGNLVNYRINLLEKIGEERVLRLEGDHRNPRRRVDDYKAIHAEYQALNKEAET